ncbi:MAG: DUF4399 domain-containing protein [Pseudorhodobacter sp.]|nr:DUF4399 domain-containing protein [Pseudorhodobacter sp.]
MNTVRAITTMLAMGFVAPALAFALTPAPEGAGVYIISPSDGDTLGNPVTIVFGLTGMGVAPAGADVPSTGHHHLLINIDPAEVDMMSSLPADDNYRHFGGGQTQVTLDLPQGSNTLFLLLGDHNHIPHDPPIMSEVITITVE